MVFVDAFSHHSERRSLALELDARCGEGRLHRAPLTGRQLESSAL